MTNPASEQYKPLVNAMEDGVKTILADILGDYPADLNGPVQEIALTMATSARRNRPELVEACQDQLLLMVLERELAFDSNMESILNTGIRLGLNALVSGAIGGLASL